MDKLILGFITGILFAAVVRLLVINIREKRGLHEAKFRPKRLSSKARYVLRKVVFDFSIKKFNRDFVVNIKIKESIVMQLIHRAHFPELNIEESDIAFGIAIYIPLKPLSMAQRQKLERLLNEEVGKFVTVEQPFAYFLVDIRIAARFGGYLLARILKEIFRSEDADFELADEGSLPYR
ncbi:hypothetical protein [Chryseolinea soli]|uniref:Uncharacterized protein n=1 Tax=Chryseolinea soli TaxID=2321403 RepID=A0A385SU28_9BACT|nr:hypothetical protein [Chryseolinea soli]AYB33475.1 hypothetical protein D4L85_24080 [Chryseolinea soli]